ncbi:MAG TPA: 1,4-dihydroxy-2-naphthoate polyprenyltransferase [Chitinophagales bacterium]|nr:1,4-dihydroxy-2-naphthoate polyprenyltransferase [Chitinophagales bacterium]
MQSPSAATYIKSWLKAIRLRTLPLSLSCIAMGSFLAGAEGKFSWAVFILAVITTLFLQILSNLANDYGDTIHGADSKERIGPARTVQSGEISLNAMRTAMGIFGALALVSGISLLLISFGNISKRFLFFFALGVSAIAAAVKYTAGRNPYGYKGLGDLFVFLFFGIVGVAGSYFLFTHQFNVQILLPAASLGWLCAGVLNVNNMRDRISDAQAGKMTLAVRLGPDYSKYYHLMLIVLGWISVLVYTIINYQSLTQFIYLILLPLFTAHVRRVMSISEPALLDKQLKTLALSNLAYCITFGIGVILR